MLIINNPRAMPVHLNTVRIFDLCIESSGQYAGHLRPGLTLLSPGAATKATHIERDLS
jgi:hypothetical protein